MRSLSIWVVLVCSIVAEGGAHAAPAVRKPNIILILADDLGYGDLGSYGQRQIRTPHLDRLAASGVRFTHCYAGSTVCAPSRCALMTGMHMGHARIRGNGLLPLRLQDITLAEVLAGAGYHTAMIGKWGLGEAQSTGAPDRQGFDEYFGYLNQVHAHNYYPDHLWRNGKRVPLANVVRAGVATRRVVYSPDLVTAEALRFVEAHAGDKNPFFLYWTPTLPHANNEAGRDGLEVPSDKPYDVEAWPMTQRRYAAMVSRLDTDVGRLLDKLRMLDLERKTLVMFTSDNGPHREGGADPTFFDSAGGLRGHKRSLHEGGIRVPMIVRYPGKTPAGAVSDQMWAFWDVLPTLAALAGAPAPPNIDGQSMVPALLNPRQAIEHAPLYWEFFEKGFAQAARMGNWKAVRPKLGAPLELYDLAADPQEKIDVAATHADVVGRFEQFLKTARTDSLDWPIRAEP